MKNLALAALLACATGACHKPGHTILAGVGVVTTGVVVSTDDGPGVKPLGISVAVFGALMILYGLGDQAVQDALKNMD